MGLRCVKWDLRYLHGMPFALFVCGCFSVSQNPGHDGVDGNTANNGATASSGGTASNDQQSNPVDSCGANDSSPGRVPVDEVDLLFVIDSSRSMLDEQQKLKDQIPPLLKMLASGKRPDGTSFPAAKLMHVGVVTTDMGVPDAALPDTYNCSRNGGYGDDAKLQVSPGASFVSVDSNVDWAPDADCGAKYPKFMAFDQDKDDDTAAMANDVGCLVQVGPGGCGYEMQLEASLKALWPAVDIDPNTGSQWIAPTTGQPGNRITFLTTTADAMSGRQLGQGDGYNNGFLRESTAQGTSIIAVMLITDEDDCSSKVVDHLRADSDPSIAPEVTSVSPPVPVNLRCVEPSLQKYLWESNRYVQGLQALRPGNENLVIFGAIAGVPQYLVDAHALSSVDSSDESARAQFYGGIRNDSNMALRLTPTQDTIEYACTSAGASSDGAYPALRILDVVEGFGENGIIQSICEESFESATNLFVEAIARQLSNAASADGSSTGAKCK